jgi:plastocyanin
MTWRLLTYFEAIARALQPRRRRGESRRGTPGACATVGVIAFGVFSSLAAGATFSGRVDLTGTKVKDLSGVVVWLEPVGVTAGNTDTTENRHVAMTQKNKTFVPHILAVSAGTTVDFPNQDPIFHDAFSSFDGKVFDVGLYPPGTSRSVRFDRGGVVRVFCNIHPSMSAVIVVVKTPWFAVSAHDGSYQIDGVPEGDYTLRVYHERATPATLNALTRPLSIKQEHSSAPPIAISETGYLPAPHKNKFGKDYPNVIIYSEHEV